MIKSKSLISRLYSIRHLILITLLSSTFVLFFTTMASRAFRKGRCSSSLSEAARKSRQYYRVTQGKGSITKSNFPQVLPIGFGSDWNVEKGIYDPPKKQISLVIKKKVIGIFLERPLVDNQPVQFTADTCGYTSSDALALQFLINRPQLVLPVDELFQFKGSLIKRKDIIEGTFSAQNEFLLTANLQQLKPDKRYRGIVDGKFLLRIEKSKSGAIDGIWSEPVQALW